MTKLYIDVTQAYEWQGEVTGIIRVMDEISLRFSNNKDFEVEFLVWDKVYNGFTEVNFGAAIKDRHKKNDAGASVENDDARLNKGSIKKMIARVAYIAKTSQLIKKASLKPSRALNVEAGSILFMPHGGVWESDEYIKEVLLLKKTKAIKLVPIAYDFCPVLTPQFCSPGIRRIFKNFMRQVLPEVDHVIAISSNTAEDYRNWLAAEGIQKIPTASTIRLGDEVGNVVSSGFNNVSGDIPKEFALCVGTIEARKNHAVLYYAYKLAADKEVELPAIIIVGRKGWMAEDIYEIIKTDPGTKEKLIFRHDTSDSELAWLYQNSLFTIYPSFYEGWGLPVAESLLRGVPCIASNTSSIPEIAGDMVDYFSPYSPEELLDKIKIYLYNPKTLERKKEEVKAKYKSTLWDQTYNQVAEILKAL